MIWKGQFNAILILLLVGSCTISAQTDNAAWVLNTGTTVLVVWLWRASPTWSPRPSSVSR